MGGEDQYFSRVPTYGLLRGCYELKCYANDRTDCNRSRRRIKERCYHAASRKGRENFPSSGSDDSEAVLSLLSEEADKDATGIKWKNASSSKRMEAEKKRKNASRERHLSLSDKIKTEKKGNLKQHETSSLDLRREYEKPENKREALTKSENHKKRRDVSSCSSYYSLSSGDFENDLELQHDTGLEEFSLGYEKDETNHMEGKGKEEFNRQRDDSEKVQDVSNKERIAFGADIDWSIRKKSEKKLTEGTMQETASTREQQDRHSRASIIHGSSHGKASISHKRIHSEEDNSSYVENLDKKTNKAYIQTGNRIKHQSTNIQESGCDEVETTLLSGKTFSSREGNLEISETLLKETSDEHEKFVASTSTTGKETSKSKKTLSGKEGNLKISETLLQETNDEHKKFIGSTSTTTKDVISSQKYIGNSKIEDTERASNTRMKNVGEKKYPVLSSVQGVEEQHHHKGEKIVTQARDRRRKSQQFSEVSQAHGIYLADTSITKSKTNLKNREETTQSFQHSKGSDHVSTLSEGYESDEKQVSSSQKTFEKMRFIPKSKLAPVVNTRENSSQTDERIFELIGEDQRPSKLSISNETASREKSGIQGSLNLVSQAGKHEGDERSSAIMLAPSSSQMSRGSAHVEHTTGIASTDIFLETSESGSSALYENSGRSPALLSGPYSSYGSDKLSSEPSSSNFMTPEDALGSANRLEELSKQFVDEFAERVRHEVTTSETQEMGVTGTTKHDSSSSAGFPGAKGPSDEMWDVTEPSVEHGLVAEESENNKETAKPIVNRTGRSLWGMIADIVRLRVGSSTSAGRSGERNSSNKSDSETGFSGQEHEETSKSDVIKETSVLPQAVPSDQLKPGNHYTQSEGEVTETKKLRDKGKHVEVGSSSPNTLESGSTSVGASYASGEENASWTEEGKDLKVTTSGIKNMELPISLSAGGHPVVGEIVNISGSDMSGTESVPVVAIKEPVAPVKSELSGSERKDGALKQRKLQRNNQVSRDRFDEWEEAYKLELEQRRIDETFMREALLEARKAADTWEVPVGAVLVQHGKIIARGCNLYVSRYYFILSFFLCSCLIFSIYIKIFVSG